MTLDDESREIDAVVARLSDRFPDADSGQIRAAVAAELAGFDDATVRDFVPVLVESAVSDRLREQHVPVAPDGPADAPAGDGPLNSA
ncbi:three-helix bundle dimerization domain-containing protein [Cellulomonas alba]|uniref:CUE domain-containing protein n=1 Tax=Cellulomonas alba TaxID=3053467 RepID=A0ABT7SCI1_9CELL|nr:hypothetical protein [Cellulomonas alba]MDM7853897.1 hypothetical protein [Cellulomonas alba]